MTQATNCQPEPPNVLQGPNLHVHRARKTRSPNSRVLFINNLSVWFLQQGVSWMNECAEKLQCYSKWLSGYSCAATIPCQIWGTTTIWQSQPKVVYTVSRDRVRVYPGTEGTNQNRHWNHNRWHATNSLERTRLSCWSYVYWTVHHLDSWIKRDQLDVTCFIISLFNAQHVSDVNTSILRSLRLICWVISWVVLLWFDVCWCYVVVWLGWCGIRMQAKALVLHCGSAGVVWYPYAGWSTSVILWFGWGGVVSVCRLKH